MELFGKSKQDVFLECVSEESAAFKKVFMADPETQEEAYEGWVCALQKKWCALGNFLRK